MSRHRKAAIFLMLLAIGIAIYAASQISLYGIHTFDTRRDERLMQELITQNEPISTEGSAVSATGTLPAPTASPTPTAAPAAAVVPADDSCSVSEPTATPNVLIQFTGALAINPDTVGHLRMGESINTYVVQRDNSYYLNHSFYGESSVSGAIFLDVSSSICPQSRNIIIHGHNMRNGTSFGKLTRFKDADYLHQYPIIYFSTLYESANYLPFAIVYYSVDDQSEDYLNIYQINYLSDDEFLTVIKTLESRSIYHLYTKVKKTDQILTLTTCATGDTDMRFAVFAVKQTP